MRERNKLLIALIVLVVLSFLSGFFFPRTMTIEFEEPEPHIIVHDYYEEHLQSLEERVEFLIRQNEKLQGSIYLYFENQNVYMELIQELVSRQYTYVGYAVEEN